jgi:hypothetical protein
MKKLFLILCISFVYYLPAQNSTNLNVSESIEYSDNAKSDNILSIHTSDFGFTGIVRGSKRNFIFDIFDQDLTRIFSKTIESSKKEAYVGDVFYGDEIKFFTAFSPKKNERIVYCHIFNLNEKTYKKVKVFEASVEKKGSLFSGQNKRQTSFAISPDGNFIAIATDDIKKNSNAYTVRIYNSSTLELNYKQSYQKDKEKFFEPNDLSIDNSARAYVLGKLYKDGRSQKKKGLANYDFLLYQVTTNTIKSLKLDLESEHIQSLTINAVNDKLHLLGFYSKEKASRIKGGCNFIVDTNTFSIASKKMHELPQEVYEDLYGYRKANKKKDKELSSFYVDYAISDENGNTYILAEEFYVTQTFISNGNMGGTYVTTYHYDDILILKFNPKGELDWGRSIFKRDGAPSYNAFLKDNKLHVVLNSGKNLSEKKDGRTKVSQGWFESSALYDFVFSENGDVSYDKIQNNKGKTYYTPYYGTFSNDRFIMVSKGGLKKRFMMLQ